MENESSGYWNCVYAYADDEKLYFSKTGEELDIEDLYCIDIDEMLLRFSFAIRKTKSGLRLFSDDLSLLQRDMMHFIVNHEALDDILIKQL